MKLIVTQENLTRALQVVGKIASGKAPLPILGNILFKAENNRLLLAATNLEIATTQYIGGKIEQEGSVTVPARLMSEFISSLPKGNVSLESDGAKLKITSGAYTSTINGMLPDEFPALPEITPVYDITLPAATLKRSIQQTVLAASGDETRPVLTGVFCHTHEGNLYLAGTDGYRLAERSLGAMKGDIAAIIPAPALQDVLRVMNDDITQIRLMFDDNQVRFLLDDIEITSRLIDGAFPAYRQLIPAKSDIAVTINHDEFGRIVKVAGLFARESGGSITLQADQSEQKLHISSVASQLGENTSAAEATVSADGQVTLNSRYLLDALGCIDSPQVVFRFSGKLSPCVLTADSKEADYKHVIMPLKS